MTKEYQITLYGKKGCNKCKVLNERLDKLLEQGEWQSFGKEYIDIESVDGLVSFVKAEILNPQRIPSFIVKKRKTEGNYEPLINPELATSLALTRPWRYIGIETDYSEKGKGLITPQMITNVLRQAKTL